MVDLTVLGISLQEEGGTPVLLLHPRGTQRVLSVRIGPMEAFAISSALHGDAPTGAMQRRAGASSPPQTHDLLLLVLAAMGGTLRTVELLDLRQGVFTARIILKKDGLESCVDCRPSDGVALALRCGAAIRAMDKVLAHAEDIEIVMAGLPEHVRTLAAAKLAESDVEQTEDWTRIPRAVEEALAAKAASGMGEGAPSPHEALISVAKKMLADEEAARQRESEAATRTPSRDDKTPRINFQPKTIIISPDELIDKTDRRKGAPTVRRPQIRVTMVRHTGKGEAEIMDEFEVPAGGIPREVLASLGLSRREAAAVNGASEDERWATLLRMLSPQTKVPM